MKLKIDKRVFKQGEIIDSNRLLEEVSSDYKITLSLVGEESVEFSVQSITGKRGVLPILNVFLPTRHFREELTFLNQKIEIQKEKDKTEGIATHLEVPLNAIPSFFGRNSRITYHIVANLVDQNGSQKTIKEQILIDPLFQPTSQIVEHEIEKGTIKIKYDNPLIINRENKISLSVTGLSHFEVLRFYLIECETVTASSMTFQRVIEKMPMGEINFDEDFTDVEIKFFIPKNFQHSVEGLSCKLEHFIKVVTFDRKKKKKKKKERELILIPVEVQYPVHDNK